MTCNHDERFQGVLFTTTGCLACELEKMIFECERLGTKVNQLEKVEAKAKELEEGLRVKQICHACWNNLEPDGSCITCRLEKRVRELEEELEKYINE